MQVDLNKAIDYWLKNLLKKFKLLGRIIRLKGINQIFKHEIVLFKPSVKSLKIA